MSITHNNRKLFYKNTYMLLEDIDTNFVLQNGRTKLLRGDAIVFDSEGSIYINRQMTRGLFDDVIGFGTVCEEVEKRKEDEAFWFRDDWILVAYIEDEDPTKCSQITNLFVDAKKCLRFTTETE